MPNDEWRQKPAGFRGELDGLSEFCCNCRNAAYSIAVRQQDYMRRSVKCAEVSVNNDTAARHIQYVKVREASPLASEWGIAPHMSGEVLCQYKSSCAGAERLDVKFPQDRIIWGAPAAAFEFVGESSPAKSHSK